MQALATGKPVTILPDKTVAKLHSTVIARIAKSRASKHATSRK